MALPTLPCLPRLDPNQPCSQLHLAEFAEQELGSDCAYLKGWAKGGSPTTPDVPMNSAPPKDQVNET